jgi:hypothetical protein
MLKETGTHKEYSMLLSQVITHLDSNVHRKGTDFGLRLQRIHALLWGQDMCCFRNQ